MWVNPWSRRPLRDLSRRGSRARDRARTIQALVDTPSLLATASRGLMAGDVQAGEITVVLAVAVALTAVFAPLTTLLYRRG